MYDPIWSQLFIWVYLMGRFPTITNILLKHIETPPFDRAYPCVILLHLPLVWQSHIYICIWNLNLVITVPADGLAPHSARPSAGTMLIKKLHIFFMPPPLGAGGIMFSGCPSGRPSGRPKPEIPSFDLYMDPLVHPTNHDRFTACPSVRLSNFGTILT